MFNHIAIQSRNSYMKKSATIIVIVMALLLIGACSAAEEEPSAIVAQVQTSPTMVLEEPSIMAGTAAHRWTETVETTATETQVPEPTASAVPTTAPTETPEIVASVSDECLACHMDKETLIETAAPEEKAPSESSGVG
jgi:hypothetical protein